MSEAILESQPKTGHKIDNNEAARISCAGPSDGSLDFGKLVADHRAYFLSGATRSAEWRESQLTRLAIDVERSRRGFLRRVVVRSAQKSHRGRPGRREMHDQ